MMLLRIYRALIRSKLDYGSIVYASASETNLKSLNTIQNTAMRLALGAIKSSPTDSLAFEAHETPLKLRREPLLLNYFTRKMADQRSPVAQLFNGLQGLETTSKSPSPISHVLARLLKDIDSYPNFNHYVTSTPPWSRIPPDFHLSLHQYSKRDSPAILLIRSFQQIIDSFAPDSILYTDASKSKEGVGWAVTSARDLVASSSLPEMCGIYTGELFAIYRAMKVMNGDNKTFAIYSDSLGALQEIKDPYSSNPLIQNIQDDIHILSTNHCKIHLVWIPSHIGIAGNELADSSAGNAARSRVIEQHFYLPKDVSKHFTVSTEVDHIVTKCPVYSANSTTFQIKDELRKNLHSTVD
ncbi:uncharacterized protein [Euwallacea fornicatus]|uniref:uncharacterized protein n=1 Tax=Euwallacea fornicatus TaxID=995702 RepID=UPI00338FEC5E